MRHRINGFFQFFLFSAAFLALASVAPAQWLESYKARKEAERTRPNPFLSSETPETKNALQEYYRRLLTAQRTPGAASALSGLSSLQSQAAAGTGVILDGSIDPHKYIVGPSDVFTLILGGSIETQFVAVSPEGTLVVPSVGAIPVSGLSLSEARRAALSAIGAKYRMPGIALDLAAPRVFRVHVVGLTGMPGSYPASAVDRVDHAVALSGALTYAPRQTPDTLGFPERNLVQQGDVEQSRYVSLRNIEIKRRDGSTIKADLIRYFACGDSRFNPTLLDGDVIVLRPEHTDGNSIGIYGAVAMEGTFEYRSDDSLPAAIDIAGGLLPGADETAVEIVRYAGRDSIVIIKVNLNEIRQGHRPDPALRVNDRIFVQRSAREDVAARVGVYGEVRSPGAYPIPRSGARLSELIARAGGFTERASLPAAKIIRRQKFADPALRSPDFRMLDDMRLSGLSVEGREYYVMETALGQNRVSVDFSALFDRNSGGADVLIEDGDVIYIPQREYNVAVLGQVQRPGYLPHMPDASMNKYIARAGGAVESADLSEVKVIKYGSGAWVDPDDTVIEPGDKIWVPRKRIHDFDYYIALFRDVFTVLATVVTAVALYLSATK